MPRGISIRSLSALAALLTGCGAPSKPQPKAQPFVPERPGTSLPVSYPILVLGMDVPHIRVFETEEPITTTSRSSSLLYANLKLIDSAGGLYDVGRDYPVGKVPSSWSDMIGIQTYRIFIELKFEKKLNVDKAREMVQGVAMSSRSDLGRTPEDRERVQKRLAGYRTLAELIEGCKDTNAWLRD